MINLKHLIFQRGTIAGNLMLKHMHNEFYSDIFLLFDAVDAKVEIGILCFEEPISVAYFRNIQYLMRDLFFI